MTRSFSHTDIEEILRAGRAHKEAVRLTSEPQKKPSSTPPGYTRMGSRLDPSATNTYEHTLVDKYSGRRTYEFESADGRMHWMDAFRKSGQRQILLRALGESDKAFAHRCKAKRAADEAIRNGTARFMNIGEMMAGLSND